MDIDRINRANRHFRDGLITRKEMLREVRLAKTTWRVRAVHKDGTVRWQITGGGIGAGRPKHTRYDTRELAEAVAEQMRPNFPGEWVIEVVK